MQIHTWVASEAGEGHQPVELEGGEGSASSVKKKKKPYHIIERNSYSVADLGA